MKTREIADLVGGELSGDRDIEIFGVAALDTAGPGQLAFVDNSAAEIVSNAACLIVPINLDRELATPSIRVSNPKLAFARTAAQLHSPKRLSAILHPSAIVAGSAHLGHEVSLSAFTYVGENSIVGDGTQLMAGAKIGERVTLGRNCVLHQNVFIGDDCTLGDGVILHSGVVIGTDGFGYVRDFDTYVKFPQIGTVFIGDEVEIGANSCVDRGALGVTHIGAGTKIDNLVQIAHNVQIGKRVIIAAQTGISGSTVIEDDCVIGGQVGMGDHARVQAGAVIGSQAGILPGKIVRPGVWWGTPIQPLDQYKRQNAQVKGIGRLKDEIKALRDKIDGLVSRGKKDDR